MGTVKELQSEYIQAKSDHSQAAAKLKQIENDRAALHQNMPKLQEKLERFLSIEEDMMLRVVVGEATQKEADDLTENINLLKDEISKSKKLRGVYQEGQSKLSERVRDAQFILNQARDKYTSSEAVSRAQKVITLKVLRNIQEAFAPWAADNGSWESFLRKVLPMPDDNALSASVSEFKKNL